MPRVVYLVFSPRTLNGGNKVTFRHVEALTALGFDAVVRIVGGGSGPTWFRHAARLEDDSTPLRDDDILVLPEDNAEGLRRYGRLPNRKIVFCQNPYYAAGGLGAVDPVTAGATAASSPAARASARGSRGSSITIGSPSSRGSPTSACSRRRRRPR